MIDEDKSKLKFVLNNLIDEEINSLTLRVKRTDGVIITVLLNGKCLFNEKGVPVKLIGTTLDITKQLQLQQENEELASIIEYSTNEVYIVDKDTYKYLYVNKEALNKLGYTRQEMYNMHVFDINKTLTPDQAKQLEALLIEHGSIFNKTTHTKKDGSTYPVQSYLQHRYFKGKEVGIIFDIDISELVEAEEKQKKQAQILEQIHDSVVSTDLNNIITHWNHGATIIHGYVAEEMIGKSIDVLYPKSELKKAQWIRQQALLLGVYQDQITKITKSGNIIYTDITASVLKNEEEEIIGITKYTQDITQRKEIEEKLKEQTQLLNFQAYHDSLTKLPNRSLFDDRLQQSITFAQRHNEKFGLLFIDLDNFKQINDTLGHHYGDEILKIVAQRISGCLKKEDTLSRVGGDEFTVIVQNLQTSESISNIAEQIIQTLKPKIIIDNYTLHITASIGISLFPKDSILKNDLLKYADTAMYKAKDEGRNSYQFYSSDMTLIAFEKATMESYLHRAIEEKQFIVHYQPQIDIRDNSIVGIEALIRWQHPEMGLVFPNKFIGLAEESGFIQELDSFVMFQAMKDMQEWCDAGLNPGTLSINLSMKQLMNSNFLETLTHTIQVTKFNLKLLEFEITENQMMLDPMKSIETLQRLSKMGISIAIDDFGTGYSSLAYLKRLPVNKLKIDQSFIQDLPENEEDAAITKAVIALAKSLKLNIIAEGVENKKQIEYLLNHECYHIQGYYYAKALTKNAMTTYIKNNQVLSLEI